MSVDHYTYRVTWSAEDGEHIGLCAEFPSLSWLAKTSEAALKGIRRVVSEAVADMQTAGETIPVPLAEKHYSGEFRVPLPSSVFLVIGILAITGCASTHNLKADGINLLGGGFIEEELQPGFFRMSATSNTALWASVDGAAETWKKRADQLCGKDAYVNVDTFNSQDSRLSPVPIRHGIVVWGSASNATISGYVLCNTSRMTAGEATDFLKNRRAVAEQRVSESLKTELDELGGDNCAQAQQGVLAETYFRRGKKLVALQRYSDAKSCFILAQELEKGTHFFKESCMSIGFMYEIGLGVDKDNQKAQEWYRKAGL